MIYMTTKEWYRVEKLIEAKNFGGLIKELCVETYDFAVSQEKLDKAVEHLKSKDKKAEKRLWKAMSTCIFKQLPIPGTTKYTDVRELTVDEAVDRYKDWAEHLNDYGSDTSTVYAMGLFYKKDGEWVEYEV
jgi:hypothetical protein